MSEDGNAKREETENTQKSGRLSFGKAALVGLAAYGGANFLWNAFDTMIDVAGFGGHTQAVVTPLDAWGKPRSPAQDCFIAEVRDAAWGPSLREHFMPIKRIISRSDYEMNLLKGELYPAAVRACRAQGHEMDAVVKQVLAREPYLAPKM